MIEAEKLFELYILADTFCCQHNFELNVSKMKILCLINKYSPAPATLLISKLGIIKTNFSSGCLYLQNQGLITCKKGKEDKRNKYYLLTEKGKELLDKFYANLTKYLREEDLGLNKAIDILNKKI